MYSVVLTGDLVRRSSGVHYVLGTFCVSGCLIRPKLLSVFCSWDSQHQMVWNRGGL